MYGYTDCTYNHDWPEKHDSKQLQIHSTSGKTVPPAFQTILLFYQRSIRVKACVSKMESTKEMTSMHPLDVSFDDDSSSDEQYHTHHSIQFENDQYEDQGGQKRSIKKWTEEEVSKLVGLCPMK